MQQVTFTEWTVIADREDITLKEIDSTNQIKFRPAEVDKMSSILGMALQMESLKALPSQIVDTPFIVKFKEDDSLGFTRDNSSDEIVLTWRQIDGFLEVLRKAVAISVNDTTFNSNPNRHTYTGSDSGEPFI